MAITEEELMDLIEPKADIEKVSTVSSAGETFSTRIPKDIMEELKINKGDKIRWFVQRGSEEIKIKLEKANGSKEKEKNY